MKSVHNGLRHSFISYRLADIQNAPQVELEAGNSPAMIFKHYRELVTREDAVQWFGIRPVAAPRNVIPFAGGCLINRQANAHHHAEATKLNFADRHPDCRTALAHWFQEMRKHDFSEISEVRRVFPHADKVGRFTVFNIGGNKCRLVAAIHYNRFKV